MYQSLVKTVKLNLNTFPCLFSCHQIRKQAIKDLPALCRDTPEHLPRIADVLTQLLQTDDNTELSLVQTSLLALLRSEAKGVLLLYTHFRN
jgi:hypothetical protein